MKTIRRLFYIGVAILLVFASLTACAPQQEEELTELDLIKAEWRSCFVDRTNKVKYIGIQPNTFSSFYGLITEQPELNAILDLCKTLDLNLLQLEQPWQDDEDVVSMPMSISIYMDESCTMDGISICIETDGRTTLLIIIDEKLYRAYVEEWDVYEYFSAYCYIDQGFDGMKE